MATSRSVQPSNNPYASGAITLDSSPYVQYALNQHAKDQAKQEALDNYFKTVDSKITSAGMRTQEVPQLLKQQNDDRLFYLKNRDAILDPTKDNGTAYNEYLGRNQSKLAWIENSKKAAETTKQYAPIVADPTKSALMGDDMIKAIHLHDLALDDPNHKDFNISDFAYNPKPFDINKYANQLKPDNESLNTSYESVPDVDPKNPQFKKREIITAYPKYDNLKLATAADMAYENDPSLRGLINKIGQNPLLYDKYNTIYKNNFGKDLDIQHPEQIAVSYFLEQKKPSYQKSSKEIIDTEAQWKAHNLITSSETDNRERLNREAADKRAANLIAAGAVDAPQKYLDNAGTGNKFAGSDMVEESYPNSVLSEFGKTVQVKKDPNSEKVSDLKVNPVIVQNPSTKQRLLVYPIVNSKGEITPEYDIKNSTPVTDQALKTVLGDKVFNSKIKGTQFVGDKKVTTPSSTKIPDWLKKK